MDLAKYRANEIINDPQAFIYDLESIPRQQITEPVLTEIKTLLGKIAEQMRYGGWYSNLDIQKVTEAQMRENSFAAEISEIQYLLQRPHLDTISIDVIARQAETNRVSNPTHLEQAAKHLMAAGITEAISMHGIAKKTRSDQYDLCIIFLSQELKLIY